MSDQLAMRWIALGHKVATMVLYGVRTMIVLVVRTLVLVSVPPTKVVVNVLSNACREGAGIASRFEVILERKVSWHVQNPQTQREQHQKHGENSPWLPLTFWLAD